MGINFNFSDNYGDFRVTDNIEKVIKMFEKVA